MCGQCGHLDVPPLTDPGKILPHPMQGLTRAVQRVQEGVLTRSGCGIDVDTPRSCRFRTRADMPACTLHRAGEHVRE